MQAVNNAKPFDAEAANGDGRRWLRSVEMEARGLERFGMYDLTIMKDLKPPSWAPTNQPAWPPYRPLDLAMVTPVVGGDPRLHSSRWYEVWEEEQQRRARTAAE